MTRRIYFGLLLGALLAVAGCNTKTPIGEVEGTVTLDGKPVEGIIVTFVPDLAEGFNGPPSYSSTDTAGHYSLKNMTKGQEGVFVGKHRVSCKQPAMMAPGAGPVAPIPHQYWSVEASPLRFEVQDGKQIIDVRLTSDLQAK